MIQGVDRQRTCATLRRAVPNLMVSPVVSATLHRRIMEIAMMHGRRDMRDI